MSQLSNGILGTLAVALTFGALQFASGSDLRVLRKDLATNPSQLNAFAVNRNAKSDRGMLASFPSKDRGQTVSFQVDRLADTSVVMRVPTTQQTARVAVSSGSLLAHSERKPTVACEPMVSVLTDVAKLLQPGRCVT